MTPNIPGKPRTWADWGLYASRRPGRKTVCKGPQGVGFPGADPGPGDNRRQYYGWPVWPEQSASSKWSRVSGATRESCPGAGRDSSLSCDGRGCIRSGTTVAFADPWRNDQKSVHAWQFCGTAQEKRRI